MARRKQKNLIDPQVILRLLATLAVLGLVIPLMLSRAFLAVVGIVFLTIVAIPIAFMIVRRAEQRESRRTLLEKSKSIVDGKIGPLVRSRAQLVRQDAYGLWQTEKWEKEKSRFIAQHIQPALNLNECKVLQNADTSIRDMIEARVEEERQKLPVFQNFSDEMTPTEFEMFCAEELRQAGWYARVTMQSCDQGTDVVAEKDGVRVVLQCKKYTGSVGNKSVQEISAGKLHEQANYAAVVTNSKFTSAAQQLASTNGVLLLHYCDLRNLENLLR